MFETFDSIVVQIEVSDIDVIQIQAFGIDRETVILGCNLNLLPFDIQDRVISAMMSELQLVRLAAERESHDLMPETNPEHRLLAH